MDICEVAASGLGGFLVPGGLDVYVVAWRRPLIAVTDGSVGHRANEFRRPGGTVHFRWRCRNPRRTRAGVSHCGARVSAPSSIDGGFTSEAQLSVSGQKQPCPSVCGGVTGLTL